VNAISALEKLTHDKRASLDPMVAEEIAQSLSTIDRAIGDTRAALKKEPGSLVAQASLLEALRMKVSLLHETVSLIGDAERETSTRLPKS
jgi:signal transduction histidine kinase